MSSAPPFPSARSGETSSLRLARLAADLSNGITQQTPSTVTAMAEMKPVLAVIGPRDAGPGERQSMLERAHALLDQAGAESVTRVDVPAKGGVARDDDDPGGALRGEVEVMVPALQSGSLFGGRTGVLVMDAQNLLKAEATIAADLVPTVDSQAAVVVFVSLGALPAPLSAAVKANGESVSVKKYRERDASSWLVQAARDRSVSLHGDAVEALVRRFGSDVAALAQALDQLEATGEEVTGELVEARFANRPDEPMWHYSDALAEGDVGTALRRLADFLTHGHPLQLLAFVAGDLRRRCMAAAAPDIATYAEWVGAKPDAYPVKKAWQARGATGDDDLRLALGALVRADLHLKTQPEESHRVMLERLTVALCRWYGGRTRRAG